MPRLVHHFGVGEVGSDDRKGLQIIDGDPSLQQSFTAPPPTTTPALDAAAAYALATRRSSSPEPPLATVVLATADAQHPWPDGVSGPRLAYVVRWENVSWMPGGPPLRDGGSRGPVVGSKMTLIDALTGAFLGTHLSGTSQVDRAEQAVPARNAPVQEDLATFWAGRSDMDDGFIVKAGSLSRWCARELWQACTTPGPDTLPERVSDIGTLFARRLHALDAAVGPGIGPDELADIRTVVGQMLDTANGATSRTLPPTKQVLLQAISDVLTRE